MFVTAGRARVAATPTRPTGRAACGPSHAALSALQQLADRAAGVVQPRYVWTPNRRLAADPNDLPRYTAEQYQQQIGDYIDGLADTADRATVEAQGARWLNARGLQQHYSVGWDGDRLFLSQAGRGRLEYLGRIIDDQDEALYLKAPDTANLYVRRSDGSEWARDSAGRFLPRKLTRSIDTDDRATLHQGEGLRAREPGAHATKLEHVSGLRRSQYASYTRSTGDVMNAQGTMFNAAGRGRVTVDLANVASERISDLSTKEGVRAHLYAGLSVRGKENFNDIVASAKVIATRERSGQRGAQPTAGTENPFATSILTNQQWQAMVDVFRTQEVLVEGAVDNDAVLDFTDATATPPVGANRVETMRGANQEAADALSERGRTALEGESAVAVDDDVRVAFEHTLKGIKSAAHHIRNKLQNAADTSREKKKITQRMVAVYQEWKATLALKVEAFQNRRDHGWEGAAAEVSRGHFDPVRRSAATAFQQVTGAS